VNSAAAKMMNTSATAVRRSEKARFLLITTGLGGLFSVSLPREKNDEDKKNGAKRKRGIRT
jgi:hypothetical protein